MPEGIRQDRWERGRERAGGWEEMGDRWRVAIGKRKKKWMKIRGDEMAGKKK